jgi:hypothetical protein
MIHGGHVNREALWFFFRGAGCYIYNLIFQRMKSTLPKLACLVILAVATLRSQAQTDPAQDSSPQDTTNNAPVTAAQAPPALPDYQQPPCPTDGYLWQPGYWAFDLAGGYYWIPGVWLAPPAPSLVWTPAYWAFADGLFIFHQGYWGGAVGFYGGIDYGYGYGGSGFTGGVWIGQTYRYNTAVVNVNTTVISHTYVDRSVVINNSVVNRASFNGRGGTSARPSPGEITAMGGHHFGPTGQQYSNQRSARSDGNQFYNRNHGIPAQVASNNGNGNSSAGKGDSHLLHSTLPSAAPSTDKGAAHNNQQLGPGRMTAPVASAAAPVTTTAPPASGTTNNKLDPAHTKHATTLTTNSPISTPAEPTGNDRVPESRDMAVVPAATAPASGVSHIKHAILPASAPLTDKGRVVSNQQSRGNSPVLPASFASRVSASRAPSYSSSATNSRPQTGATPTGQRPAYSQRAPAPAQRTTTTVPRTVASAHKPAPVASRPKPYKRD